MVVWPVADEMQLLALHALGFKAPAIREKLGNRYSIHQVRYQLREHRRPWPERWTKLQKLGWRYLIPEGPPELWKRLKAETNVMNKKPGIDLTTREAEKLLQWRNGWRVGSFDCYKGLGVQVFGEMIGDATFRKLVMKQLQLPKALRRPA